MNLMVFPQLRYVSYIWRLCATAVSFSVFSAGGLVLSAFVFPPLLLMRDKKYRAMPARWVVHKSFAAFVWMMEHLGIMRFTVENRQGLTQCEDALVLANHPTLIDVVALIALMPNATCVVKRALWRSPFMGGVVRAANYISNDTPDRLIDDCAQELSAGNPLIIFPEGTRTRPGQPLRFLRGASYIALHSGKPIVPVLIRCMPSTLTKCKKWYQIPPRRFELCVKILPPMHADQWTDSSEPPTLAARRLTHGLETFFTQELEKHG